MDKKEILEVLNDFDNLKFDIVDNIAVLTVNRPKALNALNMEVLIELAAAFELVEAFVELKALLITGEGRAFVAGADITELQSIADNFAGREASLMGQNVFSILESLQIPTIAAINGFALGGGLELSLACDLRVASSDARLGLPEVGLGLIPGYGGTQRLPRLIGKGRALDLILTGRHVKADEALQMGLVNRVSDNALETALELAKTIIKNAPLSIGLAKEAITRGLDLSLSQGLEVEADMFGMITTSNDMKEGTAAFLEKRAAEFKGN